MPAERYDVYTVYTGSCNGGLLVSSHDSLAAARAAADPRRRHGRDVVLAVVPTPDQCRDGWGDLVSYAAVEIGVDRPWLLRRWTESMRVVVRCRDRATALALAACPHYVAQWRIDGGYAGTGPGGAHEYHPPITAAAVAALTGPLT